MRLKDKVALVTGGARGIGQAIAMTFAKEGADIVVADVNLEVAQKTASEIESLGRKALALEMDVTDYQKVEEGVNKILDKFGKVDILVNNAGITKDNLLLRMSQAEWDAVISVNLKGTFNCIQKVSRFMLNQKSGNIINIASVIGLMGNIGQSNYAASKGGIIALTKSTAKEFATRNIRANAIAPGFIETEMTAQLSAEVVENYAKAIPLQRMGKPVDVANACIFLASDEAAYITGQTLQVDGGLIMS